MQFHHILSCKAVESGFVFRKNTAKVHLLGFGDTGFVHDRYHCIIMPWRIKYTTELEAHCVNTAQLHMYVPIVCTYMHRTHYHSQTVPISIREWVEIISLKEYQNLLSSK